MPLEEQIVMDLFLCFTNFEFVFSQFYHVKDRPQEMFRLFLDKKRIKTSFLIKPVQAESNSFWWFSFSFTNLNQADQEILRC